MSSKISKKCELVKPEFFGLILQNLKLICVSKLFGILRGEIEFRYYCCRNSTKSMREKKKKVERENVELWQRGYRISCAQFCYPGVRGVPEVKRKKKIDKLIVAISLPK